MTELDLNELTRLDAAATPSPWFVRTLDDEYCMGAVAVSTKPDTGNNEGMRSGQWPSQEIVAVCLIQQPPYVVPDDGQYDENAELIAAVRNALPELLRLAKLGLASEQ